ncbi:MAG TPA: tetratricopeptide repeat protein [Azospirillum sp.]|nr:tetratricopeptide repeat protein [Azospirillum sp.]
MNEVRLDQAREALRTGQLDHADQLAQAFVVANPSSAEGLNVLGSIEIRRRRPDKAVRLFSAAAANDGTVKSRMNLGRAFELLGDSGQAAAAYRSALDRFPDHGPAKAGLLRALFSLGRMEEVVEVAGPNPESLPLDVEGLHRVAVACLACNQGASASSLADRALALDALHVPSMRLKSTVLVAAREWRQALAPLSRLQSLEPGDREVIRLRAEAADALNAPDAERWLRRALWDSDGPARLHAALARRLMDKRLFQEAERHLRIAHQHHPDEWTVAEALSDCLLALKQNDALVALIREVLDRLPENIAIWNNLCVHLKTAKQPELAVAYMGRAALLFPDSATLLYNKGLALNEAMRAEEAEACLNRATAINPRYAKAWNALSVAYSIQYRAGDAEQASRRALQINPKLKSAWLNYGIAMRGQGKLGDAVKAMRQAVAVDPKYAEAQQNLGYTLCMLGEIEQGFHAYDWRWAVPGFSSPKRPFKLPVWDGRPLPDPKQGLLVYMEQGMGDEIMFSWYLNLLRRDVKKIVVECDTRLVPLFRRSFPDIQFAPRQFPTHRALLAPDLRFKTPVGHLPKFYWAEVREHIYDVWHLAGQREVRYPAYLTPDPDRVAHWKAYLRERAGGRPLIGVSWRSALRTRSRDVQYLEPAEISKALGLDVAVVNLQYSYADDELEAFREEGQRHGFHFIHPEGIDLRDDLDDVMALIAALDLIVSPLISVAWMGGALGVPTWVLRTSEVSRIWQQLGTPMVPWVPSLRLFFRKPLTPWDEPLRTVRGELEAWLKER